MDNTKQGAKTIFILGAGASAQSGVPVMSNFLDIAEVLWRTGKVESAAEHFETVFEGRSKLQAVFSKARLDIMNIEDVFAAFEMGRTLASLPIRKTSGFQSVVSTINSTVLNRLLPASS